MKKILLLRLFLGITALEGLLALVSLLSITSDSKGAWLFGYSPLRIAMAIGILIGVIFLVVCVIRTWKDKGWGLKIIGNVYKALERNWIYPLTIFISGLILIVGVYAFLLLLKMTDTSWHAPLLRLMPVILWLVLISIQILIAVPLLKHSHMDFSLRLDKSIWRISLITLFLISSIVIFVSTTRIGLQPIGDWETIGVPLSSMQVTAAVITAIIVVYIGSCLARFFIRWFAAYKLDFILALIIWVVTVLTWQAVPVKQTFNAPRPTPPNYEYYPHSGAAWQDVIAQNLIIGEGYKPDAENEKPLYAFLLAGLHAAAGQDYGKVVNLQIVLLAFFPVVLFLFARLSFNRLTGLILAVLVIMRERNALILMGEFDISNSKLLLTDMPGTLLLSIFILFSFFWLRQLPKSRLMAFLSGGLLGLSMMLRYLSIVLIFIVAMNLFILFRRDWKKYAAQMGLFALGVFLVVAPWLWRNFQITGQFFTVLPFKGEQFVQRFKMESGLAPRYDDLNTFGEGLERLIEFSREHPIDMAQFITAHFLHNEISTLLSLPASYPLVDNINTYVNLLPYWESKEGKLWSECCSLEANIDQLSYWGEWDGKLVSQSYIPVLVNLILISIGLGVSWKRDRIVGLYPLFIHLLYNQSSVIWGLSGWRFILPVDWIGIYYFCVGLVSLILLAFTFFTGKEHRYAKQEEQPEQYIRLLRNRGWILAIIVLGIGLLVPVVELVIPQRYTPLSKRESVEMLEEKLIMEQKEYVIDTTAILDDTTIEAYVGRGLYPRFYQAGEGEPGTSYRWPAHTKRDYSRLGFYLAGPDNWSVVLPLDDTPQFFPNAQDVLLFGCRVENYLIAQVIVLLNTPGMIYESSIPCSSFEK